MTECLQCCSSNCKCSCHGDSGKRSSWPLVCEKCGEKERLELTCPKCDKILTEWIKCSEQLPPEENVNLLFCLKENPRFSCERVFSGWWAQEGQWKNVYAINGSSTTVNFMDIIAWMPLPDPPK